MTVARSIALFALAALAEIGGAWLIWQGLRENRGLWWIAGGVIALGLYGFVATFQPDPNFGRSKTLRDHAVNTALEDRSMRITA